MVDINDKLIYIYNKIIGHYNNILKNQINEIVKNYNFKQKVMLYIKNNIDIVDINKHIYNEIKFLYKQDFDEYILSYNNNKCTGIQINDSINYVKYIYHLAEITRYDLDLEYDLISLSDVDITKNNSDSDYKYYIGKIQDVYKFVKCNINGLFLYENEFNDYFVNDLISVPSKYIQYNKYVIDIDKIMTNKYVCFGLHKYDYNSIKKYFSKRNIIRQLNIDYNFIKYINIYYLISDKDLILSIVRHDGMHLADVDEKFKNDFDVVIEAVKNNGMAIQFASSKYKNHNKIVEIAIKQNPFAYQYVSQKQKLNFMFLAIRNCASNINFIPTNELTDDIITELIVENPYILMFIDVTIKVLNNAMVGLFTLNGNNKNKLDYFLLMLDYGCIYSDDIEFISIISYYVDKIKILINEDITNIHCMANIMSYLHYKYNLVGIVNMLYDFYKKI